jgi:DMSO/TMAO reductase YedYZ molybdopterin-dependent catalytic subunit
MTPGPRPTPNDGRLAGIVAAGVALGMTELVTGLAGAGHPSLITAVGSWFIDLTAGGLKDLAVTMFGTNDKAALIIGIVVVCLLIGAAAGRQAIRRAWVGPVAFSAFGLFGIWVGLTDPQADTAPVIVAGVLGAVSGAATLAGLLWLAGLDGSETTAAPAPGRVATRRTFLTAAGSAAAFGAVLAAGGRRARGGSPAEQARRELALPSPVDSIAVPDQQPFDVRGLTPYVTPNDRFYRIDTALLVPQVDVAEWRLAVTGMVDRPLSMTLDELLAEELVEVPITLSCVSNEVGGDLVGNAVWLGAPLARILARAGVRPEATQVVGRAVDGFTVGFPTEVALDGRDALIAVGMNGEPLPVDHGFPARLVVPGLYGYVSATKWLEEIELTTLDAFDAYWVPRGWAKEAPVKTASRIDVPRGDVDAGRIAVAGVAWAPHRGISRVEVRVDEGPWRAARLGATASDDTWVQWRVDWDATPGEHRLQVRAVDGDGMVQIEERSSPIPDGATGYHTRTVMVS